MTLEEALGGIVKENQPKDKFSETLYVSGDDDLVSAMSKLLIILLKNKMGTPEIEVVEEQPVSKLEMVPSPS